MTKVGIYVRCPIDENEENPRSFILGQIAKIDNERNLVGVIFHDPQNLRTFFTNVPASKWYKPEQLVRSIAFLNSVVIYKGFNIRILSINKTDNDLDSFYSYNVEYIQDGISKTGQVTENQIKIPFTKTNFNPVNQMLKFELHNPQWYKKRRIVSESLNIVENSPYGFKHILGTRVHLYNHQVDTIIRALSENPCRLMLADEVGLGKTIEALSIIKGLMEKRPNMKTIVIVPDSLVYQWQTEMSYKFWIDAPIWNRDIIINQNIVLVTIRDFTKNYQEINESHEWDMCVVDETHRALYDDKFYDSLISLCIKVENLLLLSATPIMQRKTEYHKLLSLLKPGRYMEMKKEDFAEIVSKQSDITNIVFNLMQDIPDYDNYDLTESFISELNAVNDYIKDKSLSKIIASIDPSSNDKGLSSVKLALAYISEFYQIDRNIIRHRRKELGFLNINRNLAEIQYEMAGADIGSYEENTYNLIMDYIQYLLEQNNDGFGEFELTLISAATSSPYALYDILTQHLLSINSDQEMLILSKVIDAVKRWRDSVDKELIDIIKLSDYIDSFHSKMALIIDYIDQEDVQENKKYLIFTGFTKTAIKLEAFLKRYFGDKAVTSFHREKSQEEVQNAATTFQNDDKCRFIICDESGGEGRNFQKADYVVHFDLPWSPAVLEQRIGRLDRIGRDSNKEVMSIVIHSIGTIEDDLFSLYNNGLNIFKKSLCGLEIAFEQINNSIKKALANDIKFGLKNAINEIEDYVEIMKIEVDKEVYYDLARQLDVDLFEKLQGLIEYFTDNDGEKLMKTMMAWPFMAGFQNIIVSDAFQDGSKVVSIDTSRPKIISMQNALYFPPRMDEIIRRSRYRNDIRGTFSRKDAVNHEDLSFFAPFNKFFDSITSNAEECFKGRSCALQHNGCKIDFQGFVTTWNIRFNPIKIHLENFPLEAISLVSRYLPNNQIVYIRGLNSKYKDAKVHEILEELDNISDVHSIHLGKRDNRDIERFKVGFDPEVWESFVTNTYKNGIKYSKIQANDLIDCNKAREQLENILIVSKSRELYYGYNDEHSIIKNKDIIDALIYGLENPIIELDSIAFVILKKEL